LRRAQSHRHDAPRHGGSLPPSAAHPGRMLHGPRGCKGTPTVIVQRLTIATCLVGDSMQARGGRRRSRDAEAGITPTGASSSGGKVSNSTRRGIESIRRTRGCGIRGSPFQGGGVTSYGWCSSQWSYACPPAVGLGALARRRQLSLLTRDRRGRWARGMVMAAMGCDHTCHGSVPCWLPPLYIQG
jgi:hypothetical protein